jgi:hypothetical protein
MDMEWGQALQCHIPDLLTPAHSLNISIAKLILF